MDQKFIPLNENIQTADAENPRLVYEAGNVVFRYTDWKENERCVKFSAVVGYKWQDEIDLGFPERDDMPYQVVNSYWMDELKKLNVLSQPLDFKHYKLCFNACGVLDIICGKLEVVS